MEMNELERVFAVGRQRIICVSLSLTVKSINNNKNTPKHLPINAGGKKNCLAKENDLIIQTCTIVNNVGYTSTEIIGI